MGFRPGQADGFPSPCNPGHLTRCRRRQCGRLLSFSVLERRSDGQRSVWRGRRYHQLCQRPVILNPVSATPAEGRDRPGLSVMSFGVTIQVGRRRRPRRSCSTTRGMSSAMPCVPIGTVPARSPARSSRLDRPALPISDDLGAPTRPSAIVDRKKATPPSPHVLASRIVDAVVLQVQRPAPAFEGTDRRDNYFQKTVVHIRETAARQKT